MIVLTLEEGEDAKLAEGAPGLQRKYGMPIDPNPYARTFSSEPACRAVVAARLNAPGAEAALLRRLRVRAMLGGLLDDPELMAAAAADIGLDGGDLARWSAMPAVEDALRADIETARSPSPAARGSITSSAARRPSAATRRRATSSARTAGARDPGLQPDRGLRGRAGQLRAVAAAKPESVERLLAWAGEPLATVEVIAIMQTDAAKTRAELARVATPIGAGADFYWHRGDVASPCGDGRDHSVLARPAPDGRGAAPGHGLQRRGGLPARATATCCSPSATRGVHARGRRSTAGAPAAPQGLRRRTASCAGADARRGPDRTSLTLRDLPGEYSFATLFSQRLDVGVRLERDGEPVAETRTPLEVYDVAQMGSLYERIVSSSSCPTPSARSPGLSHAYHPWFPVLLIGAHKAELYTRALVGDIVHKRHNLADPGWLVRVGLYLELLTALGIVEARQDAGTS